jgi:membrane protein involved in colicin uptake
MLDALTLWDAHAAQLAVEAEEKRAAAEAQRAAAAAVEAAKAAKKAAKDAALRVEAEKLLARIPPKGTTVTVDGFTGKVFWTGASKYYGKWTARAGVKNAKGTVQWVSADRF